MRIAETLCKQFCMHVTTEQERAGGSEPRLVIDQPAETTSIKLIMITT